jgi:hypothetical protein
MLAGYCLEGPTRASTRVSSSACPLDSIHSRSGERSEEAFIFPLQLYLPGWNLNVYDSI